MQHRAKFQVLAPMSLMPHHLWQQQLPYQYLQQHHQLLCL
uniref:Uncharacterized protein n=1 Tax=Siphoviridae sp. ct2vX3 TaxID=2825318 RepID=A0A8S5PXB7_9CAUD|nr:MAG TPA: hypothetical protein [Siphoviridae sp. ct2vX3]